jgi:hypothetical protein
MQPEIFSGKKQTNSIYFSSNYRDGQSVEKPLNDDCKHKVAVDKKVEKKFEELNPFSTYSHLNLWNESVELKLKKQSEIISISIINGVYVYVIIIAFQHFFQHTFLLHLDSLR